MPRKGKTALKKEKSIAGKKKKEHFTGGGKGLAEGEKREDSQSKEPARRGNLTRKKKSGGL